MKSITEHSRKLKVKHANERVKKRLASGEEKQVSFRLKKDEFEEMSEIRTRLSMSYADIIRDFIKNNK